MMRKTTARELPIIGWREWVSLPEFGIDKVKAKVDTGARSSSLHAFDVRTFTKDGIECVRFRIRPIQRSHEAEIEAEAVVVDRRSVRSSSGAVSHRLVIRTLVQIAGKKWPIEITLANRDEMGFRMLLGREAIRNRALVDTGRSFLGGKQKRSTIEKTK